MRQIAAFLSNEILWGRLAWTGLLVTVLASLVFAGAGRLESQPLYIATLVIFGVGGLVAGNSAPRHPFANAFVYTIFCLLFATGLLFFFVLGGGMVAPPGEAWGGAVIFLAVLIAPAILAGTLVAVTFRHVRRLGERLAGEDERTSDQDRPARQEKKGAGGRDAPKERT